MSRPTPSTGPNRRAIVTGTALLAAAALSGTLAGPRPAGAETVGTTRRPGREPIPRQVPVKEGKVDVGEADLYYWDTGGRGPAVVLLHPFTGSALSWPYQQPVLARAGYRVIAYSRRGHYGSSPLDPGNLGIGSDDLRLVADHLEVERFHAVGIAAGAITALDFAVSHPRRVASMTIGCSTFGIREPSFVQLLNSLRPTQFTTMPMEFQELSGAFRATAPDGVAAWLDMQARSRLSSDPAPPRQGLANTTTFATLQTLEIRTLLLTGDADLYLPPPVLRTVASHLPRSQVEIIEEAGHAVYWEQPHAFNRTLLGFLSRRD